MSSGSGTGALGGIVAIGIVYWVAVAIATVIAFAFLGAIIVGVAVVIYAVMGGLAFVRALSSNDWSVVRDAILAPTLGVLAAVALHQQAPGMVLAALTSPNAIYDWGVRQGALVTMITMLLLIALLFAVLAFYIAGLGFGFIVTSENAIKRLFGYAVCILYGITYSGTVQLIIQGRFSGQA